MVLIKRWVTWPTIIGVFKNKKEAEKYLNWLDAKNKEYYQIVHTKRFDYVEARRNNNEL